MEKEHDLAKWLAGEMTASELQAFEQSPEFALYQKIKDLTEGFETPEFDSEKMYQHIISHKKNKTKMRLRWLTPVAALLVLALGLLFLARPYFDTNKITAVTETRSFELPDDSKVVLNSDSDIKYKKWNWDNSRKLELYGEAYFKVAKGKTFEVNTRLGKITVLGTQFNVKARKQRLEVECYEGKVKVSFNKKHLFLTKGQRIVVEDGALTAVGMTDNQPAWILKEIRFYNQSLETVLTELEQQYGISINGNAINVDLHYTGNLPQNNLDTALQIISKTYRFNYKKISDKEIILTPNVETP